MMYLNQIAETVTKVPLVVYTTMVDVLENRRVRVVSETSHHTQAQHCPDYECDKKDATEGIGKTMRLLGRMSLDRLDLPLD
jgi:hypothetical protein